MKPRHCVLPMAFALLLLNGIAAHSLSLQYQSVRDHVLSQTEAKDLAESASTPEDHLKLAKYYRAQSQQEEAASKFNQQLSELNQNNPSAYQGHSYSDKETKEHFRDLAKKTSKAAAKLNKMAAEEENIAKEMREHPLRGGFHK